MRKLLLIIMATILWSVAALAAAENCQLVQNASVDIQTLTDGELGIPVKIDGKDQMFELGLNIAHSGVLADYADSLKLETIDIREGIEIRYLGGRADKYVRLPNLQLGNLHVPQLEVLRARAPHGALPVGAVGAFGLDFLTKFDVEFDFKNNKLNLFSPDHCPGNVVYWAGTFAALPFKTDDLGLLSFDMMLNGKPIMATLSTSPGQSVLDGTSASSLFGINASSPGALSETLVNEQKTYIYPFKSLSMEGLAINNPLLDVRERGRPYRCDNKLHIGNNGVVGSCLYPDLIVRLNELRMLHLYFAFKEKMLYVTAADAHN